MSDAPLSAREYDRINKMVALGKPLLQNDAELLLLNEIDLLRAAIAAACPQPDDCLCLGPNVCSTCDDTGVVQEQHEGGTHPVHCPEGCPIPSSAPGVDDR